jgi:hypothetical protein
MDYDDDYDPHGLRDDVTDTDLAGAPTFFVFATHQYYPHGGMNDLHSSHHTLEDAEAAKQSALDGDYDYAHIAQFTAEGLVEIR